MYLPSAVGSPIIPILFTYQIILSTAAGSSFISMLLTGPLAVLGGGCPQLLEEDAQPATTGGTASATAVS
jgi:hypothetical protein